MCIIVDLVFTVWWVKSFFFQILGGKNTLNQVKDVFESGC